MMSPMLSSMTRYAPVPTLDITAAVGGAPDVRAPNLGDLPDAIAHAIRTVGFVQVVGHGIPDDLVDRAHGSMALIDELSDGERLALKRPRGTSRGLYEEIDGDGTLKNRGLQFVAYDTPEEAEAHGALRGHPGWFLPNVWPEGHDGFRALWHEYATATRRLGHTMMSLFAVAAGLPADHFAGAFAADATLFSVNWYPPQPPGREGRVILNEHPDSGVLTVLSQRGDYDGLQVLMPDGEWGTVAVTPGAFVINVGELMTRWTNGAWRATRHRVLASDRCGERRSSVAMFFLPAIDTVVAPLTPFVDEAGPRYEPISVWDWEEQFMQQYVLHLSYDEAGL